MVQPVDVHEPSNENWINGNRLAIELEEKISNGNQLPYYCEVRQLSSSVVLSKNTIKREFPLTLLPKHSIMIAGDFNGWNGQPMKKEGDFYVVYSGWSMDVR
jgi:hypothetical protein